ncbi:unnamed protein product, partial [Didymodactylos carnosus]
NALSDYIEQKIAMFKVNSYTDNNRQTQVPLEGYAQAILCEAILKAQDFLTTHLGENSVSQREIQRCFQLVDFFWIMRYDDEIDVDNQSPPDPVRCIALAISLIYYFRLPTKEDRQQRNIVDHPTREDFAMVITGTIPDFVGVIEDELEKFVNNKNFVIPPGVAINQAVSLNSNSFLSHSSG